MAMSPAYESVIDGAARRYQRERMIGRGNRISVVALLVLAGVISPTYAADGVGDTGSAGYHDQFYAPGNTLADTEAGSAGQILSNDELAPRRYVAPDAGGLVFQPGFVGCAETGGRYLNFDVTVSETYTDNVNLDSSGNERDAFITEVMPAVHACADTGRIKGSLDYQLQALYYAGADDPFDIYHDVLGTTTIEMISNHLFLAADSSYSQAVIDPSEAYSENNLFRSGNQTSAWVTNISPYWTQRLGPVGRATLRYRYGRTEYSSDRVPDYTLNGVYFNLINPSTNTLWFYQFNYASQRMESEDTPNSTPAPGTINDSDVTYFDSVSLRVGRQVTESLRLFATGGLENDFRPHGVYDGSVDRLGSTTWDVGFRWATPSNALEASYGHRSFGSTVSVTATHQSPILDVSVSYDEEKAVSGLDSLNNQNRFGPAGGSWRPPLNSIENRGVYVRKRLTATIGYDTPRTRTTFQAYDGSKEFLTSNEPDEDIYGASIALRYELGVRTDLVTRVNWEHRESERDESDRGRFGVDLNYQFTQTSYASLGVSHGWRNGDTASDSYDENQIVVSYTKQF